METFALRLITHLLSPTRPSTPRRSPLRPRPLLHPSQELPPAGEAAFGRVQEARVCSCRQLQQFLPSWFVVTVPSWAVSIPGAESLQAITCSTTTESQRLAGEGERGAKQAPGFKSPSHLLFSATRDFSSCWPCRDLGAGKICEGRTQPVGAGDTESPRCPDAGSHGQHLWVLPAKIQAGCSPCVATIAPQQLLFVTAGARHCPTSKELRLEASQPL